jgi:uncharacterized protein (DUF2267 family)
MIRRTDLKYDEFIGQVRHRAGLGSHAEAERATRATLETLAERLAGGEAHDLAAQLPPELARYLEQPDAGIGEIQDVRVQLPAAFAQLFNVENEGDLPEITT